VQLQAIVDTHERTDLLRFLTAGSVDDGKSTLIGRLLHDSKLVLEDQLEAARKASEARSSTDEGVDLSLLMDGLRAEREQGITIDVAYRYFSTPRRKFIIADTPGHEQYTRNMATGASTADLAVILVDAQKGVVPQTKRHSFIASLLGIKHLVIAINKMDLVDYSREVFDRVRLEYADFAARLEVTDVHFIPLSALKGDNVVDRSERMPWFNGAPLLSYLETVHVASDRNFIDFRLPIQYVIRSGDGFRGYAGTISSGIVRVGDRVSVLPSGRMASVTGIRSADRDVDTAFVPMAVTVTLSDDIDISRGDMLVPVNNVPRVDRDLEAMVVWMAETPLEAGRTYYVKQAASAVQGQVRSLRYRTNVNTLRREGAERLGLNEIGRIRLQLTRPVAHDSYARNRATGSFILVDRMTNVTVAAGMIIDRAPGDAEPSDSARLPKATNVQPHGSLVSDEQRRALLKQRPATVWLTGLPRSGKSTIAYALEKQLAKLGHASAVLDGDNMRLGVSYDLGFSADDRAENIRRAAGVARIMNDAGLIAIAAFVSPYAQNRARARETVGEDRYVEVYLSAPVEACEARDDRDLYKRARSGEIKSFSGVTAPYEAPDRADLVLPTHEIPVEESLSRLLALLAERGFIESQAPPAIP